MSLIFQNKQGSCFSSLVMALCLASTSFSFSAYSDGFMDSIQIHGFISQGIIDVNGSKFVDDDEEPSLKLTEVGINASYQFSNNIRFAGQTVYLNGGNRYSEEIKLDYLLLDWTISQSDNWRHNLYVGRFKNYHWLFSSTRDVPMSRPSIILPQSVYFDGTRDMSVGGDGVALKSTYDSEELGEIDFNISTGKAHLDKEQTKRIMSDLSNGDLTHDTDLQVSIYWQPTYSNWRFGLATTLADFEYDKGKKFSIIQDGKLELERYYLNADYQGEFWNFSVELLQESMTVYGLLHSNFKRKAVGQGGFVQATYQITPDIRLLGRYEHFYANKDDKTGTELEQSSNGLIPKYFGYQHDTTIGLQHQFSNNFEVRLEHHWYKGTARLTPLIIPDPVANDNEYWQLWAAQFTYWY